MNNKDKYNPKIHILHTHTHICTHTDTYTHTYILDNSDPTHRLHGSRKILKKWGMKLDPCILLLVCGSGMGETPIRPILWRQGQIYNKNASEQLILVKKCKQEEISHWARMPRYPSMLDFLFSVGGSTSQHKTCKKYSQESVCYGQLSGTKHVI